MQITLPPGADRQGSITISAASIERYVAAMLDQRPILPGEQRKDTQKARVHDGFQPF